MEKVVMCMYTNKKDLGVIKYQLFLQRRYFFYVLDYHFVADSMYTYVDIYGVWQNVLPILFR